LKELSKRLYRNNEFTTRDKVLITSAEGYLFFEPFFILFNFQTMIPAIAQRIEEKR